MKPLICSSYRQIEDMLYYTIGQDLNVKVEPIQARGNEARICIDVREQNQAEALRSIVPEYYEWGMSKIFVHITCQRRVVSLWGCDQYNQRVVASLFCRALRTNQLFVGVKLNKQPFLPIKSSIDIYIYPCIVPIQCGQKCCSEQKSYQVFAQVLKREFGMLLCTEVFYVSDAWREDCIRNLYCAGECID